ncbi:MAG: translation initiation factor IF-2 subunit gamma [Magnetococcales bacterium]|nr:translation initiation factor IF-2 subunit gamma [Magnetococcales bacterium]|tara:strand:+ start:44201 stop:45490 length:1290 start_codon:yes stop_codon:yes gene_type:complete
MEYHLEDIQKKQPVINIGMLGHVANGKSTLTKAITGVKTQKHSSELKRNITVKLGYANAKIWKCEKSKRYYSTSSDITSFVCEESGENCILVRHISFVDSPGHNELMGTMLNGANVMDSSILIESATNEKTPAAQTLEHYVASNLVGIPTSFVCFNKVDLESRENIVKRIIDLQKYTETTPVIPISANFRWNIDIVLEYLANIEMPKRDFISPVEMTIIRSFDINKLHTSISELKGGVCGGSIKRGVLKKGQLIKILPGFISKEGDDFTYQALTARVLNIKSEKTPLEYAVPGGLIGVELSLDPAFTVNDKLVGSVAICAESEEGYEDYNVFDSITIEYNKVNKNVFGESINTKLREKDIVKINANSANVNAKVIKKEKDKKKTIITLKFLDRPIYANLGTQIPVSRDSRLIGMGKIISGKKSKDCSIN